jgi:protein ImuB
MPRVACLVVPRFAVAALHRAEPELRGCPVAVCEATPGARDPADRVRPHARVIEASPEALRRGVPVGGSVAQALGATSDLVVRPLDPVSLAAARAALLEVGVTVSPRVEIEGGTPSVDAATEPDARFARGVLHLDVEGLDRLHGSAGGLLSSLLHRAAEVGFVAGAAVADRRATARIAAGLAARRGEALVVPPGGDAAWLAPRPLEVLEVVAEGRAAPGPTGRARTRVAAPGWTALRAELGRLGLRRVGDLAALDAASVATRFGTAGARLWRIASGCDDEPLVPVPPPAEIVEGASLEYGETSLEALMFVVRGLVDRLAGRLGLQGLACRGLGLALRLADGSRFEREVGVLAPTRDVKSLALLVRATLEADPPQAAIEAVSLAAVPDRARPDQLDLFRPAGPPPARLATTLARVSALCGPGRVGRPVAPAGHRPEAFALADFAGPRRRVDAPPPQGLAPPAIALRAIRPPCPVEVFVEGGRIAYLRAGGFGGRTVAAAGPWRVDAEWWSESRCLRDYWEVQLSDGGVYRVFREDGAWWVDGCYD